MRSLCKDAVLTFPMNAEKSGFNPAASTKTVQFLAPAAPDSALSKTLGARLPAINFSLSQFKVSLLLDGF
jgi:hypothetical protein